MTEAPPPRVALAEPELALWMEGTKPVDATESDRTVAQARAALTEALAGRGLDDPDPQQVLIIRAREVARTGERKTAQILSAAAIVLVIVAVVVVVVVLARTHSSPSKGTRAHGAAPAPALGPAVHGGVAAVPYAPVFHPRPYPPPPPFDVDLGLVVVAPDEPLPEAPWLVSDHEWLASRAWFDGDLVELTAELADPASGTVTWHRTVRGSVDPRDPDALSGLVDRALEGLPFGRKRANPVESPALTD